MNWGFDIQSFHYKGFSIRWTGWKTIHDNNLYYAQWTAYDFTMDPRGKGWTEHIYSSVPGALGFYTLGDTFDIFCRCGQHLVTLDNRDSQETMAMKDKALALLLERAREVRLGEEMAG